VLAIVNESPRRAVERLAIAVAPVIGVPTPLDAESFVVIDGRTVAPPVDATPRLVELSETLMRIEVAEVAVRRTAETETESVAEVA